MNQAASSVHIVEASRIPWEPGGLRGNFEYGDLGLKAASGGKYLAQYVRATDMAKPPIPAHRHTLDFQLVYMVKGWMRFWHENRGEVTLKAGDCMLQPGGTAHSVLGWSEDFELLEVTSPGDFSTEEVHAVPGKSA